MPAPTSPIRPPPPSGSLKVGHLTLEPHRTPDFAQARSAPLLPLSSTASLAVTTAQAAGRPYICLNRSGLETFTQYPQRSGISQSLRRRDRVDGGSGGECKATEGHGPPGHGDAPATPPSPLPQPNLACQDLGTCGRQAQLSGRLTQMGDEVGWPHGQLRAARKPQQEYGQGAAGTPQERPGWVKRPQECPKVR